MVVKVASAEAAGFESTHDKILGQLTRPRWLASESLLANTWHAQFGDPAKTRHTKHTLVFDVPVQLGGVTTAHPDHQADLITAKLLVYYSCMPEFSGSISEGSGAIPIMLREYFNFVRWRLSKGIPSNRALTPDWFDLWQQEMRRGGYPAAMPIRQRAERYFVSLDKSGEQIPTRPEGAVRGREGMPVLAIREVARQLGLSGSSSMENETREYIIDQARRRGVQISRYSEHPRYDGRNRRRTLTAARIGAALRPIELLYRYRRWLGHDPISFNPFPPSTTPTQIAKSLGRQGKRTPTIPPYQAAYLIDKALEWVLAYGPQLVELQSVVRSAAFDVAASNHNRHQLSRRVGERFEAHITDRHRHGPWPLFDGRMERAGLGRHTPLTIALFELLPAACMIVIAAFSARRAGEIDSLRGGCVSVSGDDFWLSTWISKTVRDLDKIPVPKTVAIAVNILESLSETRRLNTGSEWLFGFEHPVPGTFRAFDAHRALSAFEAFVEVPPLPSGDRWHFTPHQFRRFFGITYFHHYRYPHLAALSQFYRHYNPDMTRRYITEAAGGGFLKVREEKAARENRHRSRHAEEEARKADFDAEALNFRIDRYREVASGREKAGGFGGEALTRQLADLVATYRTRIEIDCDFDGPAFTDLLRQFARNHRLEPNRLGHSYCKCSSDPRELDAAACVAEARARNPEAAPTSPPPAYASDSNCSRCPHSVQLQENERYWRELASRSPENNSCAVNSALHQLMQERASLADRHLSRWYDK